MEKSNPQIGGKIRRLRRQKHVSQADLAAALGISASYLNLLEHNRRNITVPLLFKVAGHFGIEPGELVESDESQLVGDLMELFGDDIFADTDLTNHEIRDLAFSNPGASRAILRLFDKYQEVKSSPNRSDNADGDPEATTGYHTATEAISDFIQENANHFPSLEASAERVRHDIDHASDSFELGLKTYLGNVFGLDVKLTSLPSGIAQQHDASLVPRAIEHHGFERTVDHAVVVCDLLGQFALGNLHLLVVLGAFVLLHIGHATLLALVDQVVEFGQSLLPALEHAGELVQVAQFRQLQLQPVALHHLQQIALIVADQRRSFRILEPAIALQVEGLGFRR